MSSVRTCRTAAGPGTPAGTGSTDAQLRALIAVLKARGIRTGVEVGGTAWSAGPPPAGTPRPPGPPLAASRIAALARWDCCTRPEEPDAHQPWPARI